ncbi:MAG TPA: dUTP diphosphatase [Actinomycetota bacterium]|nr:dUTP diphosphatase [Actinomycetota bacterium]
MILPVEVVRLDADLPLPAYAHPGDAGLDLFAAEDVVLRPGERHPVRTGIAIAIPEGYAGFVHARSGRALREGLALPNAPGLIDSGYRGELKVLLVNLDPAREIKIARGEKIAQLVVQAVTEARLVQVEELRESPRGHGGFGSTGI